MNKFFLKFVISVLYNHIFSFQSPFRFTEGYSPCVMIATVSPRNVKPSMAVPEQIDTKNQDYFIFYFFLLKTIYIF